MGAKNELRSVLPGNCYPTCYQNHTEQKRLRGDLRKSLAMFRAGLYHVLQDTLYGKTPYEPGDGLELSNSRDESDSSFLQALSADSLRR